MDNSQISDMQEMTYIFSMFKALHLRNPTQAEISGIFKERKKARAEKPADKSKLRQLF